MASLSDHLTATPRRLLLAIARARGLRIPWDAPKMDLIPILAHALLDAGQLQQVVQTLSPAERAVLDELLLAGGRLPRRHVTRRHGELRPYRPWRADAPRRPWESALSPVERLWFLGLIFLDRPTDDLVIPTELVFHLPPPDQPPPPPVPDPGSWEPALLAAHDLACLLALLQCEDVRPLHGRWLPLRTLAAWGEMCAWPLASPDVRSELQTGRRRFLHYLAEAGGLLGLAGSYLTPTPAAWLWLESPPADRLNTLWQAFIKPDPACWRAYRLPGYELASHFDKWTGIPAGLIAAVVQALADLDAADPKAFGQALLSRQPALHALLPSNVLDADEELAATIVELLTGPLVWLGALELSRGAEGQGSRDEEVTSPPHPCSSTPRLRLTAWGAAWLGLAPTPEVPPRPRFAVTSETAGGPEAGEPSTLIFTLRERLPDPADLMVMMEVGIGTQGIRTQGISPPRRSGRGDQVIGSTGRDHSSPDSLSPDPPIPDSLSPDSLPPVSYRVTAASFARALHHGWSPPALFDALDRLLERPLAGQEKAMLRAWAEAAGRTTIRRLTVLETTDPRVINRLASTRRGRSLIVRSLSPRAVVVDEARLDQLVRRLAQQEGVPPAAGSWESEGGSRKYGVGSESTGVSPTPPVPGRRSSRLPTPNSLLPTPTPSGAAHAWLALKVYRGLGQFIRLPARTPQALLDHLAAQADPDGLAAAETAAEAVLAALHQALLGHVPFPPWPEDGLPLERSLPLIEQALAEGQALDMQYYTAGRDALTHRVVEPYRLEWRGDVPYLVGFCRRAQAERVFRVDRIRQIAILKPDDEKG